MPFTISGYVLEPPRVGQSNSPFTSTPNNFVNQANPSDVAAYAAAYPSSEANPRNDYLVMVTSEVAPGVGTPFTITNVSSLGGLVQITTSAANVVVTGDTVVIATAAGTTGVNGTWMVTVVDTNDFTLQDSEFGGTYTGGATGTLIAGFPGLLVNAGFGWTKNEVVQRLDYNTHAGRFVPLPGGMVTVAGVLDATKPNVQLKVTAPLVIPVGAASAPYRLSIGLIGSGLPVDSGQTIVLVANDADFTAGGPVTPGTTELSLATGNLNWNTSDLTTYDAETVRWQQQQYFPLKKSTGDIGTLETGPLAPAILLNPIPGHDQLPLLRIGYLPWLIAVEVPNEAAFTPFPGPVSGTVEWALTTGKLNFSNTDLTDNAGTSVYYDGTLFGRDLTLPRTSIGTINSPSSITLPNPATGDIIFSLPNANPYYQFSQYTLVDPSNWPPSGGGTSGTVSVNSSTGQVQFAASDINLYTGQEVLVVSGDLDIDHGVSIRFFRCVVDLDGASSGVKDVTANYSVTNAVWANPIIAAPLVMLPATPVDDDTLVVTVGQGAGTFIGTLNDLSGPTPIPGYGYVIDFDTNQLNFAQYFSDIQIPILQPTGAVQLSNTLLYPANAEFSLETGIGTNVFLPLTSGVNYLLDALAGLVYFISTAGVEITDGAVSPTALPPGGFTGTTFIDPSADFTAVDAPLPVLAGDYLLVLTDSNQVAQGVYTIVDVNSATQLTVDVVPAVGSGTLTYEILRGKEIMADRFFETVQLTDPTTSVERITSLGTIQNSTTIIASGNATFPDQTTLADSSSDFSTVLPGDTITLTSGPASGQVYIVAQASTTPETLTPVGSFTSVTACTYTVTRRLHVSTSYIGLIRFRYNVPTVAAPYGVFSAQVVVQPNDAAFSPPSSLTQGTVEVSQTTGNLNFAQADVTNGGTVFASRTLILTTDYQIMAGLGFIQFSQRLLTNEEVLLQYTQVPPNTTPPTPPASPFTERGTFLVRKELTQPHPNPTTTLSFNPTGKSVAAVPAASVWRGGRPQTSAQVTVNPATSTMTFLPNPAYPPLVTDALPSGSVIGPTENVYIDYYVFQAMGGELSVTVLNPPILTATVAIAEDTNSFLITGNQTGNFTAGFLMTVNGSEVYQIGTVVYSSAANQTTITLAGTQEFQNDYTNPPLQVASGPTPLTSAPFVPAYFSMELAAWLPIARGMATFVLPGDKSAIYQTNVVIYMTNAVGSFTDFYLVSGSQYNATTDQTTVTLLSNTLQQYQFGQQIIYWSIRQIFATAPTTVHTKLTPITIPQPQPVTVIRRVAGQVGQILTSANPALYTIDPAGTVTYATPLLPEEEFSIFYTGHQLVAATATGLAGPRLEASYTATIVPTQSNGILGQALNANYTLFAPDSFYYRVETLTNFSGEVAQNITQAAQAGTPSTGPMTSNTTSNQLYQQGRAGLFFQEGYLYNEDIVARGSLQFYNDLVNDLEDLLEDMDGRVVGNLNGRFLYDGTTGETINAPVPPVFANIPNQIDDTIEISPAPFKITISGFNFSVVSIGTYQSVYLPSAYSRFYPTRSQFFGACAVSGSPNTGDEVLDTGHKNLLSVSNLVTRQAWSVVTVPAAGSGVVQVDCSTGQSGPPLRPPFLPGMTVVIQQRDGTILNSDSNPATVLATSPAPPAVGSSPATITLGGVAGPILLGATIYRSLTDTSQGQFTQNPPAPPPVNAVTFYQYGRDYNYHADSGQITYNQPYFPFNGAHIGPLTLPIYLQCEPLQAGAYLTGQCSYGNALTAPLKFPALYGATTDDDGDYHFPVQTPNPNSEASLTNGSGLLTNEAAILAATGTQSIQAATTPPFVGTGNLNASAPYVTITLTSGTFGTPAPVANNVVRILNGLNGATAFRPILSATSNTVTVAAADAFAFHDTGFEFTVAVSSITTTGTATLAGTTLTDSAGPFQTGTLIISGTTQGTLAITGNTNSTTAITGITTNTDVLYGAVSGGNPISGAGIPNGATITALNSSSSITISAAATATATGVSLTVGPPVGQSELLPAPSGTSWTITSISPAVANSLWVGAAISGAGIPNGTTVVSILSTSSIVISQSATAAATGAFLTITLPTTVLPGWTVVMTSGSNAGYRRQVTAVSSSTQLTLASAFPFPTTGGTFRIENPLDTYGDVPDDLYAQLVSALEAEITLYSPNPGPPQSETTAILAYLNLCFTDFLDSSNGSSTGTMTLTDTTVDFQTYGPQGTGVLTSMYVFVQTGAAAGFYAVTAVPTANTLTLDQTIPTASGISYRVVTLFGAAKQSILDMFGIYQSINTFLVSCETFLSLVTTAVAVNHSGSADANAWARGYLTTDLTTRLAAITAQMTAVTNNITLVEKILQSSDALYDKRYTWVDARIDLATGYLVQEVQAIQTRINTQVQVYNQLTKLLAVEGS